MEWMTRRRPPVVHCGVSKGHHSPFVGVGMVGARPATKGLWGAVTETI